MAKYDWRGCRMMSFIRVKQTTDGGLYIRGFHGQILIFLVINGKLLRLDIRLLDCKNRFYWNIQWQNTIGGNLILIILIYSTNKLMGDIFWEEVMIQIFPEIKRKIVLVIGDYWIVKTDSIGNIQWQNTIGGNEGDER
jgi:hypothetical protein